MTESVIILLERQKLIVSSDSIMKNRNVKVIDSAGNKVFEGMVDYSTFAHFNISVLQAGNYKVVLESAENQIIKNIKVK